MSEKWESFSQEDPFNPGNIVTGSICKSESKLYGALVIQEVNGKQVEPKLIYCTPKLHYPFDRDRNYRFPECVRVEAYEKLDGTNILKFNYQDSEGNKFISFKTRLMPFIQKHRPFYEMWNHILGCYPSWYSAMKEIDHTLSFELVGYLNPHLIKYNFSLDAYLLFGVSNEGEIITSNKIKHHEVFNKLPIQFETVDKDKLIDYYKEMREDLEKKVSKIEGTEMYSGTEGSVWYLIKPNGFAQMFKCLDGRTSVLTEKGWMKLSNLVCTKKFIKVASINKFNKIEYKEITNWYKSKVGNRKLIRVCLEHKRKVSNGDVGINLTEDHKIYTFNGWRSSGSLKTGDIIYSGETVPSGAQRELIYGCLLGDGTISKKHCKFTVSHFNLKYVKRKYNFLKNLGASLIKIKAKDRLIFGKMRLLPERWDVNLPSSVWMRQNKEIFYHSIRNRTKGKCIPRNLIFTDFMLAIWYMDDGFLRKDAYGIVLATNSYSKKDTEYLCKKLLSLGIKATITTQNTLYIGSASAKIFLNKVGRFIPPEMRYKTKKDTPKFDVSSWKIGESILGFDTIIVKKSTHPQKEKTLYCLDVKDNHNFITQGGIVHNCKPESIEAIHMAASNKPTRNSVIATAYNVLEEYPEVTWDNLFVLLKEEWDEAIIYKYKVLVDSCINFVNNVTRIRNEARPIMEKLYSDNGWTLEENKNQIMRHMASVFGNKSTTLVYNVITNKI